MTKPTIQEKQIAPAEPSKPLGMAAFYTAKKSNEGVRMKLAGPDGKETEAWVDVRGVDSEAFQRGQTNSRRRFMEYIEQHGEKCRDTPEFEAFSQEEKRRLRSTLVVGWSFEDEATEENIVEFFRNAPYVAEAIDTFASKRERFAGA